MCRPKKNNDTPLTKKHKLLSSVYTAEFFSGTEIASDSEPEPMTTVTRIFNASIEDRGAIPKDVSASALEAFAPEKVKLLQEENKEWKCICCNQRASSYCSSVVGAPSMTNVICFTEKIYVVCSDEGCIDKVTRKKNEDSKKLAPSDFDFRFSFRSALRPIRIGGMLESAPALEVKEPVEKKEVMKEKKMEMESVITEEENPLFAMEKDIAQTDSESAKNSVSCIETKTKKRKHEAIEYPTQELHPNKSNDERHKRIKKNVNSVGAALSSVDVDGTLMSKSIHSPTANGTKKRDDGVKENMGVNIAPKSGPAPTKVYLREFPFIFDGKGTWHCRHCLGVPYQSGSHHYYPSHAGKPPSNYFIDQHLRMCPVMFRHFS